MKGVMRSGGTKRWVGKGRGLIESMREELGRKEERDGEWEGLARDPKPK